MNRKDEVVVNAYIKDMETIQTLEQEDRANGVVGFFAEVVLRGDAERKLFFKTHTLTEALKRQKQRRSRGHWWTSV